jgi:hypothetical protein
MVPASHTYKNKLLVLQFLMIVCSNFVMLSASLAETFSEREERLFKEWEGKRKLIYNQLLASAKTNNTYRAILFEAFNDLKVTETSINSALRICRTIKDNNIRPCMDSIKKSRKDVNITKTKIETYFGSLEHKKRILNADENYKLISNFLVDSIKFHQEALNQLKSIHLSVSTHLLKAYNSSSKADLDDINKDHFCNNSSDKMALLFRSIDRDLRRQDVMPYRLYEAKSKLESLKFILDNKSVVCNLPSKNIQEEVSEYENVLRSVNLALEEGNLKRISQKLCETLKPHMNSQIIEACEKGLVNPTFLATLTNIYSKINIGVK